MCCVYPEPHTCFELVSLSSIHDALGSQQVCPPGYCDQFYCYWRNLSAHFALLSFSALLSNLEIWRLLTFFSCILPCLIAQDSIPVWVEKQTSVGVVWWFHPANTIAPPWLDQFRTSLQERFILFGLLIVPHLTLCHYNLFSSFSWASESSCIHFSPKILCSCKDFIVLLLFFFGYAL